MLSHNRANGSSDGHSPQKITVRFNAGIDSVWFTTASSQCLLSELWPSSFYWWSCNFFNGYSGLDLVICTVMCCLIFTIICILCTPSTVVRQSHSCYLLCPLVAVTRRGLCWIKNYSFDWRCELTNCNWFDQVNRFKWILPSRVGTIRDDAYVLSSLPGGSTCRTSLIGRGEVCCLWLYLVFFLFTFEIYFFDICSKIMNEWMNVYLHSN